MTDTRKLAEDFETPSLDGWIALAEQTLRGRDPFDALSRQGYDGIIRRPLYTKDDAPQDGAGAGYPGFADFRRGRMAAGARPWLVCQAHDTAAPEQANKAILRDLECGVGAIELVIDRPGRDGVVVKDVDDLDRALDGLYLDAAGLSLDAGERFVEAAVLTLKLAEKRRIEPKDCNIALNADPLGALAAAGGLPFTLDEGLAHLGGLAVLSHEMGPGVTAAAVSSTMYHDGGASNVQELAASLSTLVANLRAMDAAGLAPEKAAGEVVLRVSVDADVFGSIAKLRALRRLTARILAACGVEDAAPPPIHAVTSARMMSRVDPWVNMLRTTVAGFAAAVGGADRMTVRPFDSALGAADSFSRRIARNVQTILAEESALARVVDPGGGSYAVERQTGQMAEAAWDEFQQLEKQGGMAAVLRSGSFARNIDEVWQKRLTDIAHRRQPLTGVSEFPRLDEDRPATSDPDRERLRKEAGEVATADQTVDAQDIPALVEAAGSGAGMAALTAALSGKGETITPVTPHRLAEALEVLRAASDSYRDKTGKRPRIFLANLGRIAEHTARATFARNLFAAGGIEAVDGSGGIEPDAIVREWQDSGTDDAVICGTDQLYADHLVPVAEALKKAGVRHLIMAGKAGKHETVCREAGVDEFIYTGCDVLACLGAAHERMGIAGGRS